MICRSVRCVGALPTPTSSRPASPCTLGGRSWNVRMGASAISCARKTWISGDTTGRRDGNGSGENSMPRSGRPAVAGESLMDETKKYGIVTLIGQLQWPPNWRGASEEQLAFLRQAAEAIKVFALALDRIKQEGTYVCNDDLQLPHGTIVQKHEAQIALDALRKVDEGLTGGRG
jgi:hypothetical protein